jgi:hypothetical protein
MVPPISLATPQSASSVSIQELVEQGGMALQAHMPRTPLVVPTTASVAPIPIDPSLLMDSLVEPPPGSPLSVTQEPFSFVGEGNAASGPVIPAMATSTSFLSPAHSVSDQKNSRPSPKYANQCLFIRDFIPQRGHR